MQMLCNKIPTKALKHWNTGIISYFCQQTREWISNFFLLEDDLGGRWRPLLNEEAFTMAYIQQRDRQTGKENEN